MRGETEEEVILQAKEHGRQAHGMTEEQLGAPAVEAGIRIYMRDMCPPDPACAGAPPRMAPVVRRRRGPRPRRGVPYSAGRGAPTRTSAGSRMVNVEPLPGSLS